MEGPDLPIGLFGHAMLKIGNNETMIIGGNTGSVITKQTHVYDHNHEEWSIGPPLIKERWVHAAGIVNDEATKAKLTIVTGGSGHSTTEILLGDTWFYGKNFTGSSIFVRPFLTTPHF